MTRRDVAAVHRLRRCAGWHAAEVAAIRWLSVDEMRSLPELLDSNRHFLDAWQRGEFEIDGLRCS